MEVDKDPTLIILSHDLSSERDQGQIVPLINAEGQQLCSEKALGLIGETYNLPDNITEFVISAEINKIVTTQITYATPVGSLSFLKDYIYQKKKDST
jgi:hypothetical protein